MQTANIQTFGTAASNVRPGYASHTAKVLGITQIILGSLCIILQVVAIVLHAGNYFVGTGFWTGIMFIIAGAFGLSSSYRKTNCMIIAFMVLSILSSVFAGVGLLQYAGSMAATSTRYYYPNSYRNKDAKLAVSGLLLVCALLEMIAAIWSSAICCRGTCCQPGAGLQQNSGAYVAYQVQYVQPGAQPVLVMAPPGTQAPPGMVYAMPAQGQQQYFMPGGQAQAPPAYGQVQMQPGVPQPAYPQGAVGAPNANVTDEIPPKAY